MASETLLAWERQPGESATAFAAFVIFRDLGPRRSLDAASRLYHRKPGQEPEQPQTGPKKRKSGQVRLWYERWQWRSRAEAYDAEQDRQQRAAQEAVRREMAQRHAREAVALQEKALRRLQQMSPDELSPGQVLDYFLQAAKLERLSRGEPDTIQEQRLQGQLEHEVSIEDFVQGRNLLEKWRHERFGEGGERSAGSTGSTVQPQG
jgi:hypothetical protein